jgi:hypothetical protein
LKHRFCSFPRKKSEPEVHLREANIVDGVRSKENPKGIKTSWGSFHRIYWTFGDVAVVFPGYAATLSLDIGQ